MLTISLYKFIDHRLVFRSELVICSRHRLTSHDVLTKFLDVRGLSFKTQDAAKFFDVLRNPLQDIFLSIFHCGDKRIRRCLRIPDLSAYRIKSLVRFLINRVLKRTDIFPEIRALSVYFFFQSLLPLFDLVLRSIELGHFFYRLRMLCFLLRNLAIIGRPLQSASLKPFGRLSLGRFFSLSKRSLVFFN